GPRPRILPRVVGEAGAGPCGSLEACRAGNGPAAPGRAWPPSSSSRMAEPTGAPAGGGELGDLRQLGPRDLRHHQLRDALAPREADFLLAQVDQDHAELAAVVVIERAGAVQTGHPVAQRQAAPRADLPLVSGGNGERKPGRNQGALAR